MQMTAADLAYLKGEAAAAQGDTPDMALQRAAENNYLAPGPARDAFMDGFLSVVGSASGNSPATS